MAAKIKRVFLGWDTPALHTATELLIQRTADARAVNLGDTIVGVPAARAGRRLIELLIDAAQQRGLALIPPMIRTAEALADDLTPRDRHAAGPLERDAAWSWALRRLPDKAKAALMPQPPSDDDPLGWVGLAEMVQRLHVELAGRILSFADVIEQGRRLPDFTDAEADRWRALHQTHQLYLQRLAEAGPADPHQLRIEAINNRACRTRHDIVLIGMADLPCVHRRMLEQVADRVTAMVFAPPETADRFDDFGCIRVEAWAGAKIALDDEQIEIADGPSDQAGAVVRAVAALNARYPAEQITIGVPDASAVPHIQRHFEVLGLPTRYAWGRPLSRSPVFMLLEATAAYLEGGRRYADFAALVRHADIEQCLNDIPADSLTLLDEYYTRHLQAYLDGRWFTQDKQLADRLATLFSAVERCLTPLDSGSRPMHEWAQPIAEYLVNVYGRRSLNRHDSSDRQLLEALSAVRDALSAHHRMNRRLDDDSPITAAQAIHLLLQPLRHAAIPPEPDSEAIELLGWLELPLDDAPALVVTGFSDGFVPESVVADAFLPDRLRRELGLLDNARRYARDAYALSAILASRPHVKLISDRRGARDAPLPPSRLLLADEPMVVARRIRQFFPERASPRAAVMLGRFKRPADSPFMHWPPPPPPFAGVVRALPVTAFRDYLACPYRFYLRHVLKLDVVDDLAVELTPARFGSIAHQVLQSFAGSQLRDSTDADALASWLSDQLQRRFDDAFGSRPPPAVVIQREQLRYRLHDFARWQAQWRADGWRIEHAELLVDHAPLVVDGRVVEVGGKPFELSGRIDRIDQRDGRRIVFDYKTGDSGNGPHQTHQSRSEWKDLQLPLYKHLTAAEGIGRVDDLGYIVLPKAAGAAGEKLAEWTDDDLASADAEAVRIVRAIERGAFYPPAESVAFDDFAAICGAEMFRGLADVESEESE